MQPILPPSDTDESGRPENGSRRLFIEALILIVSLLSLVANVAREGGLWFRVIVAILSIVVIGWVGLELRLRLVSVWARHNARRNLNAAAQGLHSDFRNLLAQFKRYTDGTRSDNIPNALNSLSQQYQIELPLPDTSIYHIWRLYEALLQRMPNAPGPPAELKGLLRDFGNVLELYHRLYVIRPCDKLRATDLSALPPAAQAYVRRELEVQRDDYNALLRITNEFGARADEAFGELTFPSHLEAVRPLTS